MKKIYISFALVMIALIGEICQAANVTIGYKRTDDYAYCYTGFGNSSQSAIKMAGAIMVTPEMYKNYIGAKISSLKISWADMDHTSCKCTIFMRHKLTDKTDILSGSGTLKWTAYSGNSYQTQGTTVSFSNPDGLTLTEDLDTFYVGYYAESVQPGSYALATSYPYNQPGAAYVWGDVEGDNYDAEGNEIWNDVNTSGTLFLDLIATGTFSNKVSIDNFVTYPSIIKDQAENGLLTITNKGTNSVSKLTLTYAFGEETKTETVTLSESLASGTTKKLSAPAYALGKGRHTITLSKVGSSNNNLAEPFEYQTVAVPQEVADAYPRTSLVEFYESENSYYVPKYYENLFLPGYEQYSDRLNLVSQHMNDQWMTGDEEETRLMLGLLDNDTSSVSYPAMSVDRSPNLFLQGYNISVKGVTHDIIYSDFAQPLYTEPLGRPSYASIAVACTADDKTVDVTVTGNIAEGVTDGEQLYVTAYLLEDSVYTDSQEQSELEKGEYWHDNLQRCRFTALWGDPVPVKTGAYEMHFSTDMYPDEWKVRHMRVVAFINRGLEGNNKWNHDIINSCSCSLTGETGIINVSEKKQTTEKVYDINGCQVNRPSKGLYIIGGKKVVL